MPALPNDPILMKLQPSSVEDDDLLEHRLSDTDGTLSSSAVVDDGGGVTEVFVVTWFWTTVWIEGDGVTDTEVDSGDVSELVAAAVVAGPVVLECKIKFQMETRLEWCEISTFDVHVGHAIVV